MRGSGALVLHTVSQWQTRMKAVHKRRAWSAQNLDMPSAFFAKFLGTGENSKWPYLVVSLQNLPFSRN